jgi:ABC-type ATPase involved in cell division
MSTSLPVRHDPPRLACFRVFGLFDEFDHDIPINLDDRITAIIAPNGRGKTVCLRLINALFRRQWSLFRSTIFDRLEYIFSSGDSIEIVKPPQKPQPDRPTISLGIALRITIEGETTSWQPEPPRLQHLDHYLPFLTRIASDKWVHDHTGQVYEWPELIETYWDRLPRSLHSDIYADEPTELKRLINEIDCHLIETQRLLVFPDEPQPSFRGERRPFSMFAISEKAEKLKAIIARELTQYAALSQSLDRSFPKRAIEERDWIPSPPDDLRTRLADLDAQRQELMTAGILDDEGMNPVTLPGQQFEAAIARVLIVYASDTKQKLDSLSGLLQKIQLFKQIIGKRFTIKQVEVDKEAGFRIKYKDRIVPLERLSSGEQHQLVLFFELLFELRSNALILIDEPELSLHVSWQKQFISDLKSIIKLSTFDVILATHSPQLVGNWQNLIVELGDVHAE